MPTEHLLLVDDDPAILTLCRRILEPDGYSVVEVKRGEDALNRLASEPFDLVLTDIRLPGMTGLEVAQRLRTRDPDVTIITMTGYSNMEMAIQALSLGVDEFIVKPFTPDSLRLTVSRALEKARLRRENLRLRALLPVVAAMKSFATMRTREQLYTLMLDSIAQVVPAEGIAVLVTENQSSVASVVAARGAPFKGLCDTSYLKTDLPHADWLFAGDVKVWREREQRLLPFEVPVDHSVLCAPLLNQDETLGCVLALAADPRRGFLQGDAEAVGIVARQAAAALANVDLLQQISRAYVNARELERLKSEFINIAGHELRTPLAILIGYASLIRDQTTGSLREYAGEVLINGERLRRIAEDMLSLKYLESGQVDLRLEPCMVQDVVRQVVNAYRGMANERDQTIETHIAPETGELSADRAMLDLMLGNLISNAIKFSPRHSSIRLEASGDPDEVTLCIRDQGKGIKAEHRDKIFDAFYQVGDSLTRDEGGLGLGLTLTRDMVRAHGGKIWVESEQSRGSTFYITLPRSPQAEGGTIAPVIQ